MVDAVQTRAHAGRGECRRPTTTNLPTAAAAVEEEAKPQTTLVHDDPSISPCGIRVGNYAHAAVALYVLGGEGSRFDPSAPAWPSASCYGRVSKKIQTWQLPVGCLSVGVVLFMNAITPSIALTYIKTLYFELPCHFDRRAFLSTTDREEIEGAKSQKNGGHSQPWPCGSGACCRRA